MNAKKHKQVANHVKAVDAYLKQRTKTVKTPAMMSLPWRMEPVPDTRFFQVWDKNGDLRHALLSKQEAEFIVRAVNNVGVLVQALEYADAELPRFKFYAAKGNLLWTIRKVLTDFCKAVHP